MAAVQLLVPNLTQKNQIDPFNRSGMAVPFKQAHRWVFRPTCRKTSKIRKLATARQSENLKKITSIFFVFESKYTTCPFKSDKKGYSTGAAEWLRRAKTAYKNADV